MVLFYSKSNLHVSLTDLVLTYFYNKIDLPRPYFLFDAVNNLSTADSNLDFGIVAAALAMSFLVSKVDQALWIKAQEEFHGKCKYGMGRLYVLFLSQLEMYLLSEQPIFFLPM